uniref:Uncharacterized protein n=1 Tax=Panagrellus redivivus TaxID=6233 RepID=A0A7E4W0E1_PANRE
MNLFRFVRLSQSEEEKPFLEMASNHKRHHCCRPPRSHCKIGISQRNSLPYLCRFGTTDRQSLHVPAGMHQITIINFSPANGAPVVVTHQLVATAIKLSNLHLITDPLESGSAPPDGQTHRSVGVSKTNRRVCSRGGRSSELCYFLQMTQST